MPEQLSRKPGAEGRSGDIEHLPRFYCAEAELGSLLHLKLSSPGRIDMGIILSMVQLIEPGVIMRQAQTVTSK
jgi:hypothetical protein